MRYSPTSGPVSAGLRLLVALGLLAIATAVPCRRAHADPPLGDRPAVDAHLSRDFQPAFEPAGAAISPEVLERAVDAYRQRRPRGYAITMPGAGALSGRRIAVAAGHGIFWDGDSGAWRFQREVQEFTWGTLREDIHNNQIAIDFLIEMVERAGGEVIPVRERSYLENAVTVDNDSPSGPSWEYLEHGSWETGSGQGFGGTYRYAPVDSSGDASAEWRFEVEETGEYPVYVHFLAGANRSDAAHYEVEHAVGTSRRQLSQSELLVEDYPFAGYPNTPPPADADRRYNDLWHYLGTFPFRAGESYAVILTNRGGDGEEGVVIADAVRIGGGMGDVLGGNGQPSGRPRWEEAAFPFLTWLDVPAWMKVGDVTIRPLYAIYRGVDAYVALHTNACCDGSGTSTWTWYPEMWVAERYWPDDFVETQLPPGTYELSDAIHSEVIDRIFELWDADWVDGGHHGANFGELRPFRMGWYEDVHTREVADPVAIPAMLMEVAFHDNDYDGRFIREMSFRHDVARGFLAGLIRHFNGDEAIIPPLPPAAVSARATSEGLRVSWRTQQDPLDPTAVPDRYRLYTSTDGLLFSTDPVETDETTALLEMDGCEPLYVRVTAANEAGESLDSPVVGAQRRRPGGARLLFVDGVDREVKTERDPNNVRSYARIYGPALAAVAAGAGFDMATDDAVAGGLAGPGAEESGEVERDSANGPYDLVIWATGETSTRDESLSVADQNAVMAALEAGVPVLLSGAEVAWDLVAQGDALDRSFFESTLGARYVSDDAESTEIDASAVGMSEPVTFGDCSADAICVEWPDVLEAEPGGDVVLTYATGAAAAVRSTRGDVLVAGFPLEATADPSLRAELIAALSRELLDGDPPIGDGDCTVDGPPVLDPDPSRQDAGVGDDGGTGDGDAGGVDTGDQPSSGDTGDGGPAPRQDATSSDLTVVTHSGCGCRQGVGARGGAALLGLLWVALGWTRRRRVAD